MNLSNAIEQFLSSISGTTKNTRDAYRTGLNKFSVVVGDVRFGRRVTEADALALEHITAFANAIEPTCAIKTRQLYLVAARRFYRWLIETRVLELDADDVVRLDGLVRDLIPRSSPLPHIVADDVIDALLRAAAAAPALPAEASESTKHRAELCRLRDLALIESLRSTGTRISELLALTRGDLDMKQHSTQVMGKGKKQRVVYFGDAAWVALLAYFKARGDGSQTRALGDLPLIARHDRAAGKRVLALGTSGAEQIFQDLAKRAGIEGQLTPHSLRHAFATKVLEATGDLAVVQDMLGHSSPATTRIYARVSAKKMREAHRITFKRKGE